MNLYYRFVRATVLVFLETICTVFLSGVAISQAQPQAECGFAGTGTEATQLGGKWMTSRDTLNVLIVFVQFPDDQYDTTYSLWPTYPSTGSYPGPTYLSTYIDSLSSQMSTNGNLTHYFRDMSFGQFIITGKTRFVVTPHTEQWYLSNGWCRWLINKEVLEALDNSIDFAEFDHWKRYGQYDIRKESDGRVDEVFMIYRKVVNMGTLSFYGGESSLGYSFECGGPSEFLVDGGLRSISAGHPVISGLGLGTTSVIGGTGDGWFGIPPYRVQIHEFAHHWMTNGTWHGHNGGGFWAMLNDYRFRYNAAAVSCANSFEKETVGWIAPDSIYQTTYNLTLEDFVTTGDALKIRVPGGNSNEFFRVEYHARLSQFDTPEMLDASAKGLYIIHQFGTNPKDDLRLRPADGRWSWVVNEAIYPPWYPSGLPVFKKTGVDRVNGYDDSWEVPYTWTPPPVLPNPLEVIFWRDRATNQLIEKPLIRGDGNDAFRLGKSAIFSPWSNPNSQTKLKTNSWVTIELVNELPNGSAVVNIYFDSLGAVSAAPSKPQDLLTSSVISGSTSLTWNANQEPDLVGYNIYRGAVYDGSGEPTYTKINASVVTGTSYTDNNYESISSPQNVDLYHRYRITAVDNQSKESVKSEYVDAYFTHLAIGTTSANKTWQIDVRIVGSFTTYGNLTVLPGTLVKFVPGGNKTLTVYGSFDAQGSASTPITFTSSGTTPAPGDWYAMSLYGGPNTLKYCTVQYGIYGIYVNNNSTTLIENCTAQYCSGYGIYAYQTPLNANSVLVKNTTVSNNSSGMTATNARIDIVQTDATKGVKNNTNPGYGIVLWSGGKLYMNTAYVTNNGSYGIYESGSTAFATFSPNGTARGYNRLRDNTLGQLYINSGGVLIGDRTSTCWCEDPDKINPIKDNHSLFTNCLDPCYLVWTNYAGYNYISGNYKWVHNATGTTVKAKLTYWGQPPSQVCPPSSSAFYGSVDYSDCLTGGGSVPGLSPDWNSGTDGLSVVSNPVPIVTNSSNDDSLFLNWISYLRDQIENDKEDAKNSLHILANLSGPGGRFPDGLGMPWEAYLTVISQHTMLPELKSLAMEYKVQEKIDRENFDAAIALARNILRENPHNDVWFSVNPHSFIL